MTMRGLTTLLPAPPDRGPGPRLHRPAARGGRWRRSHLQPVGPPARHQRDRHRLHRREGRDRQGPRLHAHHRLHARGRRGPGPRAHRRRRRPGGLRQHRRDDERRVAGLAEPARAARLLRDGVRPHPADRRDAAGRQGLAVRHPARPRRLHRRPRGARGARRRALRPRRLRPHHGRRSTSATPWTTPSRPTATSSPAAASAPPSSSSSPDPTPPHPTTARRNNHDRHRPHRRAPGVALVHRRHERDRGRPAHREDRRGAEQHQPRRGLPRRRGLRRAPVAAPPVQGPLLPRPGHHPRRARRPGREVRAAGGPPGRRQRPRPPGPGPHLQGPRQQARALRERLPLRRHLARGAALRLGAPLRRRSRRRRRHHLGQHGRGLPPAPRAT